MDSRAWIAWLFCLPLLTQAVIRQVPQEIASIQQAIDLSLAQGDTVLLARGIYHETLFIGTGNLVLCSNYPFTGDTLDIEETVLDGQLLGTIITVEMEDPSRLELNGLTMTGGLGEYNFQANDVRGGAMDIQHAGSVYIRNMVYRGNQSNSSGSAIWYLNSRGTLDPAWFYLENVNSVDNRDPRGHGTGSKPAIGIAHSKCIYATDIKSLGSTMPGSEQFGFLAMDSTIVSGARFEGIQQMDAPPANFQASDFGVVDVRDVVFRNNHSYTYGAIGIGAFQNGKTRVRNVRIENNVCEDHFADVPWLGPTLGLGVYTGTELDADSIFILNNRVENTGSLLEVDGRGELRNVFIVGNKVGSRLSDTPGYERPILVTLRDVDLYNFVMQYDTLEMRYLGPGQYTAGGHMLKHTVFHPDTFRVRKLDISHTLHIDNDEYLPDDIYSELDSPTMNLARAYYLQVYHQSPPMAYALLDSCSFRHNHQPNHLPEVDNDGSIAGFYVGSVVVAIGMSHDDEYIEHAEVRNLIMDDCDDGGIRFYNIGANTSFENCMFTNSRRVGLFVIQNRNTMESISMNNILLQNIQQQDFYRAWPYRDSLVEQSAFKFAGDGNVASMFSNFTITGCDMPVLLNVHGGWGSQGRVFRNSIISGNDYDFFHYRQPWPSFENCIVQRPVPGDNNLIGVDPLFHPDLGPPWLSPDSPAIDAGDPDPVYNDLEDPANPGMALWPSQGAIRNDIGYTGGPAAAAMDYLVLVKPPVKEPVPAPATFTLHPAWPNPFNPSTTLSYTLAQPMTVELAVYNLLGQKVRTLAFGLQEAGEHSVPFTAGELASGMYVVELKAGGHSQTQKVLLLK